MDFAADIPVFLSDFAVTATLSGVEVRGVFGRDDGVELGVFGGSGLFFRIAATDIDSDPRGEPLVIGSENYTVTDWTESGGFALLRLESA